LRFNADVRDPDPDPDPDPETVRGVLVRLSADNFYAVLTRADGWYLQAGYGERAGTRAGWYALERQDGTPDRHFRAELTSVDEVVRAFEGFLQNDSTIAVRFPWRPYVP
jgi:hypothetical protein